MVMVPTGLHSQTDDDNNDNFVYVMSNKSPGNSVIQFSRGSNGSLSWVSEVLTGGNGSGPNGADPLGSQDSLVLSGDGLVLLAVNAGSNEVSVLGQRGGDLVWLSKTTSGGIFPNSVAISGDLVYVLNSKGVTPNITGFRLDLNGALRWIDTRDLPSGAAGPNDIRFTPDGTDLLVTVSGTNQILVFPVGSDGLLGSPVANASGGNSPFGIRFGHNSHPLISEAAGSVSSYKLVGAELNIISKAVPDTQNATCWISMPRDGRFALVSNTASGTLSSFAVGPRGDVTLLQAVAASPGGAPIDSALSRDGKFLYVDDSTQGQVRVFRVHKGTLNQVISVPIMGGIQGIAAR
jgi:6-phosphogluconolactonase